MGETLELKARTTFSQEETEEAMYAALAAKNLLRRDRSELKFTDEQWDELDGFKASDQFFRNIIKRLARYIKPTRISPMTYLFAELIQTYQQDYGRLRMNSLIDELQFGKRVAKSLLKLDYKDMGRY